MGQSKARLGN
uniref:Uncharacterized protein n=1 Tax=Rhizophora mucronata TaxID=61149 RepID=A0A2P2MAW6_RHIMU